MGRADGGGGRSRVEGLYIPLSRDRGLVSLVSLRSGGTVSMSKKIRGRPQSVSGILQETTTQLYRILWGTPESSSISQLRYS